jgi:hypothetical protein
MQPSTMPYDELLLDVLVLPTSAPLVANAEVAHCTNEKTTRLNAVPIAAKDIGCCEYAAQTSRDAITPHTQYKRTA